MRVATQLFEVGPSRVHFDHYGRALSSSIKMMVKSGDRKSHLKCLTAPVEYSSSCLNCGFDLLLMCVSVFSYRPNAIRSNKMHFRPAIQLLIQFLPKRNSIINIFRSTNTSRQRRHIRQPKAFAGKFNKTFEDQ